MRRLALAMVAVGTLIVGLAIASPALAQPPDPGGNGTDTRGYELKTANGPLCLTAEHFFGTYEIAGLTPYCNYNAAAQRWTASRGGGITFMKNAATGTCITFPTRSQRNFLLLERCGSIGPGETQVGQALKRTAAAQFEGVGNEYGYCLFGELTGDPNDPPVEMIPCHDTFQFRWYVNG